jgi:hypothetical protein
METAIIILKDAIVEVEKSKLNWKNFIPENKKQKLLLEKANKNIEGMISELQNAIDILQNHSK